MILLQYVWGIYSYVVGRKTDQLGLGNNKYIGSDIKMSLMG